MVSDVDDQQRGWCDPGSAVLAPVTLSVVGDPAPDLAGKAERAPAASATVEIGGQELLAGWAGPPADDCHPFAAAVLGLDPRAVSPTGTVGLIEAFGDDSFEAQVEGGLDEAFVDRERPRDTS